MKYRFFRKISLLFYIYILFQIWHLCQYGGIQRHIFFLMSGIFGLLLCLILGFLFWKLEKKNRSAEITKTSVKKQKKRFLCVELYVFLCVTVYFSGSVLYSAIPYHGALSWKINEWFSKREIPLKHNNFFQDGIEGILLDLDAELDLPKELYLVNKYQMTFDERGVIKTIDTFFYGKKEDGVTKTYLVDYNADAKSSMTVWIDGNVSADYKEEKKLEPFLSILQKADYKEQVQMWAETTENAIYEILYWGKRSFSSTNGLRYISDIANPHTNMSNSEKKDMIKLDIENKIASSQLSQCGEIIGFTVSLHIPAEETLTPVRYIMNPEYISAEVLKQEQIVQQTEEAKKAERWITDKKDGSMYFFLNDKIGWKLVVTDAAAGSRFYAMEKTTDGGTTWELINRNPFQNDMGVTQGLLFIDENLGFAGLTGASETASQLFISTDSGKTFEKIILPLETVTELPPLAKECQFTIADYDYMFMPEKEGEIFIIKVTTESLDKEGIVFQSSDKGVIWEYVN